MSHWNFYFLPISLALYTGSKRVGAGINSLVTPHIFSVTGDLRIVFWIGLGAAALCLAVDIVYAIFEWRTMRRQSQEISDTVSIGGILQFPRIFWLLVLHKGLFFSVFGALFITSSGMVQTRFGLSITEAGLALVLLPHS